MPKADTGECVVLIGIDVYSKFIWAWPYDHPGSAETTLAALEDLRKRYTLPRSIYVDNGSHFVNQAVNEYLAMHAVDLEVASPYSSVGVVESANHLVLDRLRHLAADKDQDPSLTTGPKTWPTKLQDAVGYLNDRVVQMLACYTP
jgi:transposase InsO family protein